MSKPVLCVQGLSADFRNSYGWQNVVRNISFNIGPGETLAVVGESGSGKSVTAMSIMRLLNSRNSRITGSVRLNGRELLSLPEQQMCDIRGRDIAMIFQEPMTSLNPVRTIGFQVSEALVLHKGLSRHDAEKEALKLLDRVRIPAAKSRLKDYPHHFSGGMRQRVMIAMALACRPKLLIADEPTTALDVTIQAQILELIRDIQSEFGTSVLFITHDLGVVAEIAHRMFVMRKGEQIETGETSEIFKQAREPYTRSLLAAVPRLGALRDISRPCFFPDSEQASGSPLALIETKNTVTLDTPPALEVRSLVVRYDLGKGLFSKSKGSIHAVENVSFCIKPGETLSLVGESGCGKSTIGRSIMGLLKVASGEILIGGEAVRPDMKVGQTRLYQKVQMVFQDPFSSLNPRKTIGEAIAAPMLINKLANRSDIPARVGKLLSRVGLEPEMMHRYPQEFSGGQRQRICIARSLSMEPSVIIADEAVSALDVSIKAQIINLMLNLQQELNLSFLFISHDMAVVERISHRVAVMYMGEIVEIGPRASVLYSPQHAYTRKLLDAVPSARPGHIPPRVALETGELRSALREPGYVPAKRHYIETSPDHFVMQSA